MPSRFLAPLAFALTCLIWGLTWLASATAVKEVPPLAFAGSRFVFAGILMLLVHLLRGGTLRLAGRRWGLLLWAGLLSAALANGLMFWGVQYVESGLAAVMNLSLLPLDLLVVGVILGQEKFTWRGIGGIALGFIGLALLFRPTGTRFADPMVLAGAAAIIVGTICYAWGAVLSRPLVQSEPPLLIGGYVALVGGIVLWPISLLVEPAIDPSRFFMLKVFGAWLFMVVAASLIAYTAFLYLLRDWGPARAGHYAYF